MTAHWRANQAKGINGAVVTLPCISPLCPDNCNVNDWVLKETLLGRILNSACAALCTWESVQTLSQFLISGVQKIGPYYTALAESLIIIFVREALFISRSVSSHSELYRPCSNPAGNVLIVADGLWNLFFSPSLQPLFFLLLALRATRLADDPPDYLSCSFHRQTNC